MNRLIVGRNNVSINAELRHLEEVVVKLNKAIKYQSSILIQEDQELNLKKVESYLQDRFPDYPNLKAIANLLGKERDYSLLVDIWYKYQEELKYIPYTKENNYHISQELKDQVKEKYTTYLSEEKAKYTKELMQLAEQLNSLPKHVLKGLKVNRVGVYSVNILAVHNDRF